MRILYAGILLFFTLSLSGQDYSSTSKKAIKHFEKAKELFQNKSDAEAEQYLWNTVEEDKNFIEAWFMLAQIYLDKRNTIKAAEYLEKGLNVDPDYHPNGYLQLTKLEYDNGDYQKAYAHLLQWKSYNIKDTRAKSLADNLEKGLDFARKAIENPVPFYPVPLSNSVNSDWSEYWPSLSVDEKTIFFTVLVPLNSEVIKSGNNFQEDFYYSKIENGAWAPRQNLGPPINTIQNEGAQSISADGTHIYFTACNRADGHGKMCDLYFSIILEDGSWTKPVNLGDAVNSYNSEKHPTISVDGKTIIFSSNRGGGKGDYDLWLSNKKDGKWTIPVNLGDSINTPGREQSPFFHPDQKTLYFSSNGWPGMGLSDIFYSRLKNDGTWSEPKNIGYPINSNNDEVGFTVNSRGTTAYYASSRLSGDYRNLDIFTFDMPEEARPEPVSYISGRVYDANNMRGIKAKFLLINLETGKTIIEASSNAGEGDYLVPLPSGASYAFNVSHPGYLFYSDHFELQGSYSQVDPYKKDIALIPVKTGKSIILKNIFFDFDSYELKERSKVELDMVVEFMKLNNNTRIEIAGHTDNKGSDQYNVELSENRAREVVNYLVSKGIEPDRLTSKGYGASKPLADNSTEEGQSKNRRTEMKIL